MNLENVILRGTAASRPAANSVPVGTLYYSTDTAVTERSNGATWDSYSDAGTGAGAINQLTGDVTAGPGSGSQAATLGNDKVITAKILDANVTYAKIQDVSAASKLLGRGDSGSGDVQEITVGSGLTMTGTTLSSSGGGGSTDWDEVKTQASDQDVTNNTTPQDSTDLTFAVGAANEVWVVEALIKYSSNDATTDFKFQIGWSGTAAGTEARGHRIYTSTSDADASGFFTTTNNSAIGLVNVGGQAAHAVRGLMFRFIINVPSTGNIKVQFANVTGGASAVSRLKAGSVLRAKLIG